MYARMYNNTYVYYITSISIATMHTTSWYLPRILSRLVYYSYDIILAISSS